MKEKRQKEKVIEARKIRKQNIKEKEDQDNNRTKQKETGGRMRQKRIDD